MTLGTRLSILVRLAAGVSVSLFTGACVRVQPWQRARLAGPAMVRPLEEPALGASYRAKLLESRVGGGVPGTAVGGGCGCTQ